MDDGVERCALVHQSDDIGNERLQRIGDVAEHECDSRLPRNRETVGGNQEFGADCDHLA